MQIGSDPESEGRQMQVHENQTAGEDRDGKAGTSFCAGDLTDPYVHARKKRNGGELRPRLFNCRQAAVLIALGLAALISTPKRFRSIPNLSIVGDRSSCNRKSEFFGC
jgi:hypothetical protein